MSDSAIREHLQKMQNILNEKLRLKSQLKDLTAEEKKQQEEIKNYLKKTNAEGVTDQNLTVTIQDKKVRTKIKKDEKINNAKKILEEYGIVNSAEALEEIIESMKGNLTLETKISVKKTKGEDGGRIIDLSE
jgi:DsbC/DsbD-like thiol-disulfide interchange protein